MKFFGHPIHPIIIHFPTALLPMDAGLSVLYYYTNVTGYGMAGFYCLGVAVITGMAAIITGLIDLIAIPKENKKALLLGLYHGFLNGSIILAFVLFTYKAWQAYPNLTQPSLTVLVIKCFLIVLLFVGNYMGGRLIYKYFIGLNIKNQQYGNSTT